MADKSMLDITGVFPAVKCDICDTIYAAESGDFVAFYGTVTSGLDHVLVGVDDPKKPAKKAISVVCRDPRCIEGLVKRMLGCDGEKGDAGHLWAQVLKTWANEAGHELVESAEVKPAPPPKQLRRRA